MKKMFKAVKYFLLTVFFANIVTVADAQEITAINFDGDILGKVIPDGKVVGFENRLVGNITADSLIVNFDGKLIGGVIPQGIAIGTDARILGKVGSDGAVRMPSGQVVGRVLPTGLVINDYFEIIGGVVFPGLVYSDSGDTVGRVTGDGYYSNLQGQRIGIVTPDGYAYRKIDTDYLLEGRLMSSKMVVSLQGNFMGSVFPGGTVYDFDANEIGKIKANGYVYDSQNKIIGHIVRSSFAFKNDGEYLGVVTYNGEVVDGEKKIGSIRADGLIVDASDKIIGYSLDFASTASDFKGRYIGRLLPDGKLAKSKDITGKIISKGIVVNNDDLPVGQVIATGPVLDYKGSVKGHAMSNGQVVALSGTPIGYMIGKNAFDLSGYSMGETYSNYAVYDNNNSFVDISGISGKLSVNGGESYASPLGYVFNQDGDLQGSTLPISSLYNANGIFSGLVGTDGDAIDIASNIIGKILYGGYVVDTKGELIGKGENTTFVTLEENQKGLLSANNLVIDFAKKIIGKVLPDNTVIKSSKEVSYMPAIGKAFSSSLALGYGGELLGYVDVLGNVNGTNGSKIGTVNENGMVVDNNNLAIGVIHNYGAVIDGECSFVGVVSDRGGVNNFRGSYLGKILANKQVITDSGSFLGFVVDPSPVIDTGGKIIGYVGANGKVLSVDGAELGCIRKDGLLQNADSHIIGRTISYSTAIDFDGDIIGRSILNGSIVDEDDRIIGYQQPDGNVNSSSGLPIGAILEYKYAFGTDNRMIGIINHQGMVIDNKGKSIAKVDFEGNVVSGNKKIGYALYDLYVYNADNDVIGFINRKGEVSSFNNQNLGKINKGFVVDKEDTLIGRGNRDYNIRDKNHTVIGFLLANGDVVNNKQEKVGTLQNSGQIFNSDNKLIATAYPLQYYSKISTPEREKVFDTEGNFIGYKDEDGNLVNDDGEIIGKLDTEGNILDSEGNVINKAVINAPVYNNQGEVIGTVNSAGKVVDANGKVIGELKGNGVVVDANGNIIGGIGYNWYEKVSAPAPKPRENEDISPALELLESEQYQRSLGIALTPDGEYLGDIMEDKTVVDKDGNILGKLMPDGLVIDKDGNLIGLEEVSLTEEGKKGGVFVPPGSYGDGGAYGTGKGAPGNLGPGGGYGPGERYDPMRQAALNAALMQRRQNITVGKISSGLRKEAFDGTQKDWSEQGISKVISSWRVNMSEMILSDKPIPAVIARAIDSSNPAPITAFVERNVYAEEGRNVIIPAGSRLIGTLGGVTAGTEEVSEAARVQISWERLIRPDGSLFVFQGLTADAQGRGGALGYVDQQLFKKYTLPVLTTSLTSATSYFMAPKDDGEGEDETPRQQAANDARDNFIQEMNQVFDEILADKANIKALTYIPAGTRIIVFPNTDLWLRTVDRDAEESATFNSQKPNVLIDDKRKGDITIGMGAPQPSSTAVSAGGDVVYSADGNGGVQANRPTPLIDDGAPKKKNPTYIAPPPPPTTSSGQTSQKPSTGKTSSKDEDVADSSIPALF